MKKVIPLLVVLLGITMYLFLKNPYKEEKIFTQDKDAPLVTLELQGQMGNHLFQIAAAISYALDHKAKFCLPKNYQKLSNLGIHRNCERIFFRLPYAKQASEITECYTQEKPFNYSPIPFNGSVKLKGFFETEKYFHKHEKTIQKLFAPSKKITRYIRRKYGHLLNHPKCVGLHIRSYYPDYRGSGNSVFNVFPPPDFGYTKKAIELFDKDSLFIVCSDCIPWAKQFLSSIDRQFVFIEKEKRHTDFYLLSFCKHNITSTSSFSWWAAYLNQNPEKKVVARTPWTLLEGRINKEIIPEQWIAIEGVDHSLPDYSML